MSAPLGVQKISRSQVTLRLDLPGTDMTVGALRALALAAQKDQLPDDAVVSVSQPTDGSGAAFTRIEIFQTEETTTDE